MALLKLCLTDDLKDNLGDTLNDPSMYNEALKQLAYTFGNPILVSKSYVHTLLSLPRVTTMQDYTGLMSLSNKMKGAVSSLKHGGFEKELVSSTILESMLRKVPDEIQSKWGQKVVKNLPNCLTLVDFSDWFGRMMLGEMFVKHARFTSSSSVKERKGGKEEKSGKPSSKILNVATESVDSSADKKKNDRLKPSCCCCKEAHWTSKCKEFASKPVAERDEIARTNGLCFRCLNKGHMKNDCPNTKLRCQVEKCNFRHHTLLHGSTAPKRSRGKEPSAAHADKAAAGKSTDAAKGGKDGDAKTTLAVRESESTVLLGIVPVVLRHGDKAVHTYAVLDNGSETTLITKMISEELGIDGPTQRRRFKWFEHHKEEKEVKMVNFTFANESSKSFNVKNGFIVERLTISERKCDWPTVKTQYDHLSLLELPAIDSSLVTVLIGRDVRDANDILKYAKPPSGVDAPEAILTHFGWCVIGPVPDRLFAHDIFYDATL